MFIDVQNVTKRYGAGEAAVYALNNANFSLAAGKICVILGPSGSGKSTLLNLIGGLDTPDAGSITVAGQTITALSKRERTAYRRDSVGFVFQFYNLIADLTVEENVQVVSEISHAPLPVDEVLTALEMDAYRLRFPKELSGGQQQRVAIARAMVKNPRLLLCDELTGALDTRSSRSVLQFIEKINRLYGTTILIITHNEAIADIADTVVRIRDGSIAGITENPCRIPAAQIVL